jgi:hypothetical protein
MTRQIIALGIAAVLFSSIGCGSLPTTPTSTSVVPIVYVFTGTVPVQGSNIQSLTVTQASTATIMLASVAAGPLGMPLSTTVGVALGTPTEDGGCARTLERTLRPSLTAQVRTDLTAITRCVEVFDAGTLTEEATFALRVVVTAASGTPSTPTAAAGTETFSSVLPVLGSASRSVTASQAGSLSAIVTAATPPNVLVGLGIGIPRLDGAGCFLNTTVRTLTSPAIPVSSLVDPGTYCVKIFDVGSLTSNVNFTISAAHP